MLPEADVVMLIGARLNWLLSQGKGKTWGGATSKSWGGQKFVQVDISPQEADSNVRIDAPVVGDIGSCVSALLGAIGSNWPKPPAEWIDAIDERKTKNVAKMAETLAKNPSPMSFQSALNVVRDIVKANPDACSSTRARTRSTSRARSWTCTSRASASTSARGESWASAWATAWPPPS